MALKWDEWESNVQKYVVRKKKTEKTNFFKIDADKVERILVKLKYLNCGVLNACAVSTEDDPLARY